MDVTRKYEFVDEAKADASIDLLRNEEGNLTESVVKLGYLTIEPPVIDEEGNTIKEAVVSTKYAVDVSWSTEPLQSWEAYIVWPTPMGIHNYGSSSQRDEYAKTYCQLYPESNYCNPPEPEDQEQP
jgi:hypothetical protein